MLLSFAILALLARKPRHGYQVRTDLVAEFGADWALDPGQLYKLLARLEEQQWAAAHREAGHGGPPRKVYSITSQGRSALRRWTASPDGCSDRGRDGLIVKQWVDADAVPLQIVGSDDLLLALLRERADSRGEGPPIHAASVGSLGGLLALREGRADIAGLHLLDVESGTYNVSFIRHLLPEQPVVLIRLARREQGFFVRPGNPCRVRSVRDLSGKNVRYINRQRDAGTRLFVFEKLRRARIAPAAITGYANEVSTHDEIAAAIAAGKADVGPGIRAVADKWGLDFIPLGEECFDLAICETKLKSQRIRSFLSVVHDPSSLRLGASIAGYDTAQMGKLEQRVG